MSPSVIKLKLSQRKKSGAFFVGVRMEAMDPVSPNSPSCVTEHEVETKTETERQKSTSIVLSISFRPVFSVPVYAANPAEEVDSGSDGFHREERGAKTV